MAMVHLRAARAVLAFPVEGEAFFQEEKLSKSEEVRAPGATEG